MVFNIVSNSYFCRYGIHIWLIQRFEFVVGAQKKEHRNRDALFSCDKIKQKAPWRYLLSAKKQRPEGFSSALFFRVAYDPALQIMFSGIIVLLFKLSDGLLAFFLDGGSISKAGKAVWYYKSTPSTHARIPKRSDKSKGFAAEQCAIARERMGGRQIAIACLAGTAYAGMAPVIFR